MPRENNISDEVDDHSLTPDLEEFPAEDNNLAIPSPDARPKSSQSQRAPTSPRSPNHIALNLADRFRVTVRKVVQLYRTSSMMVTGTAIGAEPVVDQRKDTTYLMWGHVRLVSFVIKQAFNNELMSQLLGKTVRLR